jgi:hypothetical protein
MPNKRESIETLVRTIIEFTDLQMINKMARFRDSGLANRTIDGLEQAPHAGGQNLPTDAKFLDRRDSSSADLG